MEKGIDMSEQLEAKIDKLILMVDELNREHRFRQEMWDEFSPIAKLAMEFSSKRLQEWEDKGYFAFFKELSGIFEEIVTNYTPQDVENLSKSVVGILDTIRTLTQDDVLMIANEAATAIHEADKNKPMGVRGLIKATRDDDVRRGMAMMMELLRHVGKGSKQIKNGTAPKVRGLNTKGDSKHDKLAALLAPKRKIGQGEVCVAVPSKKDPTKFVETCVTIDGVEFDKDGFMLDKNEWTEEIAKKIAESIGIKDLTEEHWKLIKYSRNECLETNASPNMRKICVGCNTSAKHVFTLFPTAPAKTIAKIAGVTKPVGCI